MNSEKYKNKFRIKSIRANWWNYAADAFYFITVVTKGRQFDFGECSNGIVTLSPLGREVETCWEQIPIHFPDSKIHDFVVMPNHFHGIIELNASSDFMQNPQNVFVNSLKENRLNPQPNRFAPQSRNLASVIRGFKIGVSKYARLKDLEFKWQPRFHERIIRDETEMKIIQRYIQQNPHKWPKDEFHIP